MYKYFMSIDYRSYDALFIDHFEAADFIDDLERDGCNVIVHGFQEVSAEDVLANESLEYSYRIEMASMILLPNWREFDKWTQLESELKKLGYVA